MSTSYTKLGDFSIRTMRNHFGHFVELGYGGAMCSAR